ncbi:MAG: GNAT family N-acetyltransferase [Geminicoccaceae bacterium]
MPGQQTVSPTLSKSASKSAHWSNSDGGTAFPLDLRIGPYRLAEVDLLVTIMDLGPTVIADEDVDVRSLPSDRALFLRSAPERLAVEVSSIAEPMLVYRFYHYDRSWVATDGGFDSYFSSFSRTSRKGLTRRIKKLTALSSGRLDIRRFDRSDSMRAFNSDARAVSAKTFQERLMDDGLPADEAFLDTMMHLASCGRCYGSILYLDGLPISYLYCERQGLGWLAAYGGFDPAYAGLSPGTVHLLSVLEESFNDQDTAFFDFGPGQSDYKQFFSTHDVPCSDVLILDKTWRNRLVIETHRRLRFLTETCINLADTFRLKEHIRRKIRGR